MCIAVISPKAIAKEIVVARAPLSPKYTNTGSSTWLTVGSPSQPRPREASVMPSWVTDRDTSRWSAAVLALGFASCENGDNEFPDYEEQTVYFPYQYPVRTLVMGDDEYDTACLYSVEFYGDDVECSLGLWLEAQVIGM